MNADYWAQYWKAVAKDQKKTVKVKKKKIRPSNWHNYKWLSACQKELAGCDKKESCDILGQCIITIARIASNPALIEALKGKLDPGAVIKRLREHDPEPMASYYAGQKK